MLPFSPAYRSTNIAAIGGAAAFDPLSLSPFAWYDFSDVSTLFTDAARTTPCANDGDVIGGVADKSGNGWHLSQTVTALKPIYKTNIQNGKSAARADGADDQLVNSITTSASDYTLFVVADFKSYIGTGYITDITTDRTIFAIGYGGHPAFYDGTWRDSGVSMTTGDGIMTYNLKSPTSASIRRNGTNLATGMTYGQRAFTGGSRFIWYGTISADVYDYLLFPGLSDANILAVESYLNSKWVVY